MLIALGLVLTGFAEARSPGHSPAAGTPSLVFESRPPGQTGGGIIISETFFPGHTFRLTEHTQVTALGAGNLSGTGGETIFAALYDIDTQHSVPDVLTDTDLITTTLIEIPAGGAADTTGALSVTLDPGWYAIVTGIGRHGATAGGATLINTGTAETPDSYGPYTMNSSTGNMGLQGSTTRFFVEGETVSPPPDELRFLYETAGPAAWHTSKSFGIDTDQFYASRFEITSTTRLGEVGTWLRSSSGQIFAAVVTLDGPGDQPPPVTDPDFDADVVGTTLIDTGPGAAAYTGDFGGLTLAPGHYALVFGTGRYGATGSALIMRVNDQLVSPGTLIWSGSNWFDTGIFTFRMWLEGTIDPVAVSPGMVDFGTTVIGYPDDTGISIDHVAGGDVEITGITLAGNDPGQFQLGADVADCIGTLATAGSCMFTARHAPATPGNQSALVRVITDGTPSIYEVVLSGMAIVGTPVLEFTPTGLDFGPVDYEDTSPAMTAELANTGNGPSQGLVFMLSDADYDFDAGDCGTNLEPGASCDVAVTFSPSEAGIDTAMLSVTDDDGSLVALNLAGEGVEVPALLASPGALTFVDTAIGATTTSGTVTIENTDGGSLDVASLMVAGPHAPDFQVTPGVDTCSGASLGGGGLCEFMVDFSPAQPGVRRAWLVVDSNAPDAPHFIALTGTNDVIFHDQYEDGPTLPE